MHFLRFFANSRIRNLSISNLSVQIECHSLSLQESVLLLNCFFLSFLSLMVFNLNAISILLSLSDPFFVHWLLFPCPEPVVSCSQVLWRVSEWVFPLFHTVCLIVLFFLHLLLSNSPFLLISQIGFIDYFANDMFEAWDAFGDFPEIMVRIWLWWLSSKAKAGREEEERDCSSLYFPFSPPDSVLCFPFRSNTQDLVRSNYAYWQTQHRLRESLSSSSSSATTTNNPPSTTGTNNNNAVQLSSSSQRNSLSSSQTPGGTTIATSQQQQQQHQRPSL